MSRWIAASVLTAALAIGGWLERRPRDVVPGPRVHPAAVAAPATRAPAAERGHLAAPSASSSPVVDAPAQGGATGPREAATDRGARHAGGAEAAGLEPGPAAAAAERIQRRELARDRFDRAVQGGGFRAADMDPQVLAALRSMEVEPALGEGGMLLGLEITWVAPGGAVDAAGLAAGDRITEINGVPLHDPAALPSLLVGLPPDLTLCGVRGAEAVCGRLGPRR